MLIDVNGQLIPDSEAVISVYDHGFLYGIGFFETFRTFRGRPFLLAEHLERMGRDAGELGIALPFDEALLEERIARLLAANGLSDAYIRLSLSAGVAPLGLTAEDYAAPAAILYCKSLPPMPAELYRTGKPLQLLRTRRNPPEGALRFKSFHYMNNVMAKRELQGYPEAVKAGAEGLLLDAAGRVAEGIVSNLFAVRDGVLLTPAADAGSRTGVLPGITRRWVLAKAAALSLPVEVADFSWEELLASDEAFTTGSVQGLVPVSRLYDLEGRDHVLGGGAVGPITRQLIREYQLATEGAASL